MNTNRLIFPLAVSIVSLLAARAHAQITWSAAPSTNLWNSAGNWNTGNVPDSNAEQAVFDASNVTSVTLTAATTINKLTFNALSPGYSFSGSALTIDINDSGTATLDALVMTAGTGAVTFNNAVTFSDLLGNNSVPNLNLGTGTTLNFNAATATSSNRNMPFSGNGTVNFNSSGSLTLGTGQLQQTGGTTLNLFVNPVSVGQIRAFSNGGGGIRLHASLNKALGLGVTGSAAHDGRIFLVENGVVSSGALSTGGGSVNNATMDVTFGTDISGTGTATHSGTFVFASLNAGLAGTNATIRLDVGADDTLNMTGVISGTAGGYANPVFRKQGLGTAVLTGANSYSIPTRVAAGTLIVTPAQTGNSAVTVDDGATFGVTLTAPGTTYNTSTLTVGNGAGASLRFNVGTLGTPTATLMNANFLNVNAPTTVSFTGTNLTAGTFTLIDYTNLIGGLGFAGFSTLNLPFRVTGNFVDNAANTSVDVNITGIDSPKWRGNVNANWDIDPLNNGAAGTPNWRTLTTNAVTRYVQGTVGVDSVIFDDTATGTTDVNLTTALSPTGITVDNSALTYTFGGTGRITGATPLSKNGAGTLIIRNTTINDSTGTTTINAGTVQIGDGVTAGAGSFGNGAVVDNSAIVVSRPDSVTLGNAISGTGTITKTGGNNLTLTGAVTHTGATTIGNGTLTLSPAANYTFASALSGPGNLVKEGTAVVTLTGDNAVSHTGTTTISAGTLQIGNGQVTAVANNPSVPVAGTGLTGSPGTGAIVNNATLDFRRLDTGLVVPNQISGTGVVAVNGVAGSIVTLSGNNTFTGAVNVSLGSLRITNSGALGAGTKTVTLTNGTVGQPGLRLDGSGGDIALPSTISFSTSSTNPVNAAIINEAGNNRIAGNFTLTAGGGSTRLRVDSGTLLATGNFTPNTTLRFLLLDGAADGTITGNINNGTGSNTLGLTKDGSGTWTLTGANNYTVSTTVNAGTLLTTTAQNGGALVTVADGATFGTTVRSAGASFFTTSLSLGNSSGATLRLDSGGLGNPLVAVVTTPVLNVAVGSRIDLRGGGYTVGAFPAIDYDGGIGNAGFAGLSLITSPRLVANMVDNAGNTTVDINISQINFPRWNGNVSAIWDIDNGTGTGTQNWREITSQNPTRYRQNAPDTDNVIFNDAATGTTAVSLATTVSPDGITVDNSARAYSFTGAGKISGPTGITKMNDGVLTIANTSANDYSGVTTISGGTVVIGNGTTAGAGSVGTGGIVNDAALVLNRPDDFTITGAVSGNGTLAKELAGVATLANSANLNGDITIGGGALRFGGGGNLSGGISGPGALTVAGGTLELNGVTPNTFTGVTTVASGTLRLSKSGSNAIAGDLVINGAGVVTQVQSDQIADTATITHNGSATFDPGGAVSDTVAGLVVNATGAAQFIVRGTWNITGASVLNSGVLSIGSGATANLESVTMTGGTFRIAGNTGPTTANIGAGGFTASGGTIEVGQGTGAFDAVLNLGGTFSSSANLTVSRGGFTGPNLREINLGGAVRTFAITGGTTTVLPDIRNGEIVKTGAGTLTLNGAQEYTALTASAGTTNINANAANATITANAAVNFSVDQTLNALVIGDGGIVTLTSTPPPAPAFVELPEFDDLGAQGGSSVQAVPEPGAATLLAGGIATLLAFRRRRVNP